MVDFDDFFAHRGDRRKLEKFCCGFSLLFFLSLSRSFSLSSFWVWEEVVVDVWSMEGRSGEWSEGWCLLGCQWVAFLGFCSPEKGSEGEGLMAL